MDPNANLAEQVRLAQRIIGQDDRNQLLDEADAVRLAELALAMHEWMANGGALPDVWEQNR